VIPLNNVFRKVVRCPALRGADRGVKACPVRAIISGPGVPCDSSLTEPLIVAQVYDYQIVNNGSLSVKEIFGLGLRVLVLTPQRGVDGVDVQPTRSRKEKRFTSGDAVML